MRFSSPWFAAIVLVIAVFSLRAWRLPELTVFQGDQGLDALAARHLVLDGTWPLEGPATSAGGVHLGPLYYYLLALPMSFGAFDPVAEALFMVVLNALAIAVLYWLLALWFGPRVAVAGAALYGVSPAAIVAARSAWNPAPAPLFVVLAILGLAQAHRQRDGRWLVLVGLGLGCLIQFHYFTAAIVGVCLAFAAYETVRSRLYAWALVAALTFVALVLPFVIHEIGTGFPNVQAAANLAGSTQTPQDSVPRRLYAVLALGLVGAFIANGIEPLAAAITLLLLIALARGRTYPYVLTAALLGATLLQVVIYRGPIFEHYLAPIAPVLYIAVAAALAQLTFRIFVPVTIALLTLNLVRAPLLDPPTNHLARTTAVAQAIAAHQPPATPYAIWLQSPNDTDNAYRYQLEVLGRRPVRAQDSPSTHLYLICQDQPCDQSSLSDDWPAASVTWRFAVDDVTVLDLTPGTA